MTKPFTPDATVPTLQRVPLNEIALAPENIRFAEPADAAIPRLAETIKVCGLLLPLLVRPGVKKDPKPTMALDGRRRLMALEVLRAACEISDDYLVPVIYAHGREDQLAAAVLANAERAPVHIADIITAIGTLRRRKFDVKTIARALAYSEIEIKRLMALSDLDAAVIEQIRAGRLRLADARLMTRIPDLEVQRELAQQAQRGYLSPHDITQAIEGQGEPVTDPRYLLVGEIAYLAAGGRLEHDLFDEYVDEIQDINTLNGLWRDRLESLRSRELTVCLELARRYNAPNGFDGIPYSYGAAKTLTATVKDAEQAATVATEAFTGLIVSTPLADTALRAFEDHVEAQINLIETRYPKRRVGAVVIWPDKETVLAASIFLKPVTVE
jgi:ParB family chromosome partitioning protein